MSAAVITVAHGRHGHLRRQEEAIARLDPPADHRIVVALDDPAIASVTRPDTVVVEQAVAADGLPLAAARNAGAATARAFGADLFVFLDVDCLPAPGLIQAYRQASGQLASQPSLLSGPVAYLPPPPADGYDLNDLDQHPFHSGRPAPGPGELVSGGDHRLFWSLNFAVSRIVWDRIGGFCEDYRGYGAEDTDFAMLARSAGVDLAWVGGAAAYHQWHPTTNPPRQHLDDILRNGSTYAQRWGTWPMEGWLEAFAEQGLIRRTGAGWVRVEPAYAAASEVADDQK